MCVQRREGLVQEEDGRVVRERAGECNALTLTARELADTRVAKSADPEPLEQVVDPRPTARAEPHVCEDVEMRKERVLLEQVADAAPFRGNVDAGLGVEPPLVVERDDPARGRSSPATTLRTWSSRRPTGRRAPS